MIKSPNLNFCVKYLCSRRGSTQPFVKYHPGTLKINVNRTKCLIVGYYSIGSRIVRGGRAGNKKYKVPQVAVNLFMTSFNREGGHGPLAPPPPIPYYLPSSLCYFSILSFHSVFTPLHIQSIPQVKCICLTLIF